MIQGVSEGKKAFAEHQVGAALVSAVEKAFDQRWQRLEDAGLARKELRALKTGGHVTLAGFEHVKELRELEAALAQGLTGCMASDISKPERKERLTKLFEDTLQALDPAAGYLMDIGIGG